MENQAPECKVKVVSWLVALCLITVAVVFAVQVPGIAQRGDLDPPSEGDVESEWRCAEAFLYRECIYRARFGIGIKRILYSDAFLMSEVNWDGVIEFNLELIEIADEIDKCSAIPNCVEQHQEIEKTLHEARETSRKILDAWNQKDLERIRRMHDYQRERGHLAVLDDIDELFTCASEVTAKASPRSSIGYWHCLYQWHESREDIARLSALARATKSEDPTPGFLSFLESRVDLADRITECKPVNACQDLQFGLAGFWNREKELSEKRIREIEDSTAGIWNGEEFSNILNEEFSFMDESMEVFGDVFDCASSVALDFSELVTEPVETAAPAWLGDDPGENGEITLLLPGGVPLVLVHVPAGTFSMGSPLSERGRYVEIDDEDLHEVTLTNDYYIGKYEVTQEQWQAVMGTPMTGACGSTGGDGSYPAFCVSWTDVCGDTTGTDCVADSFIGRLNMHLGVSAFRLPTEAEWEHAARGGSQTPFPFAAPQGWDLECGAFPEADSHMWWCGNDDPPGPKPVGKKLPNPYGLHDMHGNVNEWVADWLEEGLGSAPQTDPRGPSTGTQRITRGGHYGFSAQGCRSAFRMNMPPTVRTTMIGFRVAMSDGSS